MLQTLHDRSQGWIAWVVISLISLTFVLWGVESYLVGHSGDRAVLTVNGTEISQEQFKQTEERMKLQAQTQLGVDFLDPQVDKLIAQKAKDYWINKIVLTEAATRENFAISNSLLDSTIAQIPAFQVEGKFSPERFEQVVRTQMMTPGQFVAEIKDDFLMNQFRQSLALSSFITPMELDETISLLNQSRDFDYLVIPKSGFASDVKVTERELQTYYQNNHDQFMSPETVSLDYIKLSAADVAKRIKISPEQVKQSYSDNIANYTKPAKFQVAHILVKVASDASDKDRAAALEKSQAIYKKLQQGENFAQVAKTSSDDKLSSNQGGELPAFSAGMIDKTFEDAVTKLNKVGDITPPTSTKYGYEIIKLLARETPKPLPFDQVKDRIEKSLANEKTQKEFADLTDKLGNAAFVHPNSLDAAAKELGTKVITTSAFTRDGGTDPFTKNRKILNAAFSADVLGQNNNSDVISLDNENVVVLRVHQHQAAALKPYAQVKDIIEKRLIAEREQDKAQDFAEAVMQQMQQGHSAAALLSKHRLVWTIEKNIKRTDKKVNAMVVATAFDLAKPNQSIKVPTKGLTLPTGDYVIVKLNSVRSGKPSDITTAQRDALVKQLSQEQATLEYDLYVKNDLAKAKIVHSTH